MIRLLLSGLAIALALPAAAQEGGRLSLGQDLFIAGESVRLTDAGRDDAFLAGESVALEAPVAGTAHLAGRRVSVGAGARDVYAAGMDVRLDAAIEGDATLFGYEVSLAGPVGGDLRGAARRLHLEESVAGSALISAGEVTLSAPVEGDLVLSSGDVTFGEGARVGGQLTVWERSPGALSIPADVAPEDRITRRQLPEGTPEWERAVPEVGVPLGRIVTGFISGVVAVALIAVFIAAIAPRGLARLRESLLARPFRGLWLGFLTMSALLGAIAVLGLTLIGLLAAPALIIAALVLGAAGYVVAAYAFGVGVLRLAGRSVPETLAQRAGAALVGALSAGILGLIPFLGWLFVLALALAGLGALIELWVRPRFLAAP